MFTPFQLISEIQKFTPFKITLSAKPSQVNRFMAHRCAADFWLALYDSPGRSQSILLVMPFPKSVDHSI